MRFHYWRDARDLFIQRQNGWVFIDGWQTLGAEYPVGDCNDFALTTSLTVTHAWHIRLTWFVWFIRVLLPFSMCFWLVKSPSNKFFPRHIILWRKGYGWVDSTYKNWRPHPGPHRLITPVPFFIVFPMVLLGAVFKFLFRTN